MTHNTKGLQKKIEQRDYQSDVRALETNAGLKLTHNTEVEEALKLLLAEYGQTGDASRSVNVLEAVDHQLQKARQDWLREEIVRLEGAMYDKPRGYRGKAFNEAFQTIIDRYLAELDQDNSNNT